MTKGKSSSYLNFAKSLGASYGQNREQKKLSAREDRLRVINDRLRYTPLPSSSCIRLLTIHPGDAQEVINCSLRIVDLNKSPTYTALSYSWDIGPSFSETGKQTWKNLLGSAKDLSVDMLSLQQNEAMGRGLDWRDYRVKVAAVDADETKKIIICNYQVAEVQPNLHNALWQLRQSRPGDYWIDAICINQEDDAEREAQVAGMNRVYRSAGLVLVWLGYCPAFLAHGMRPFWEWCNNPKREPGLKAMTGAHVISFAAVIYLFTKRWFKRLWVVQEMCLARQVSFWLGEFQFTEEQMVASLDAIKLLGGEQDLPPMMASLFKESIARWGSPYKYFSTQVQLRDMYQRGGRWTMDQWLLASKGREAGDPRDLIYGGMALLKEECFLINQSLQPEYSSPAQGSAKTALMDKKSYRVWDRIRVDYSAEVPEVLLNLAACMLSQPNGIRLLSFATRARRGFPQVDDYYNPLTKAISGPLASWIPNPGSKATNAADTFYEEGGTHFAACTNQRNNPRISPDGDILFLDAMRLGSVSGPSYYLADLMRLEDYDLDGSTINVEDEVLPRGFLQFFLDLPMTYIAASSPPNTSIPMSTFEAMARVLTGGLAREDDDGSSPSTFAPHTPNQRKPLMGAASLRTGLCGLIRSHVEWLADPAAIEYHRDLMKSLRKETIKNDTDNTIPRMSKQAEQEFFNAQIEQHLSEQRSLYDRLRARYPNENWLENERQQQPAPSSSSTPHVPHTTPTLPYSNAPSTSSRTRSPSPSTKPPSSSGKDKKPSKPKRSSPLDAKIEAAYARAARRSAWFRGVRKVTVSQEIDDYWYLALTPTWVGSSHGEKSKDDNGSDNNLNRRGVWKEEEEEEEEEEPKGGRKHVMMLVKGGYVPYVFFERSNGQFVLGGEAYVEGLMNGEAAVAGDGWFERIAIV